MKYGVLYFLLSLPLFCANIKPIALSNYDKFIVFIDCEGCLCLYSEVCLLHSMNLEEYLKYDKFYNKVGRLSVNKKFKQVALGEKVLLALTEDDRLFFVTSHKDSMLKNLTKLNDALLVEDSFFKGKKVIKIAVSDIACLVACDNNKIYVNGNIIMSNKKYLKYDHWYELRYPSKYDIKDIVIANNAAFILNIKGEVFSLGSNANNVIGLNRVFKQKYSKKLKLIKDLKTIKSISTNSIFSCALDEEGCLWAFGDYVKSGKKYANTPAQIYSSKKIDCFSLNNSYLNTISINQDEYEIRPINDEKETCIYFSKAPLMHVISNVFFNLFTNKDGFVFIVGGSLFDYKLNNLHKFKILHIKWSMKNHKFFDKITRNKTFLLLLSLKKMRLKVPRPVLSMILSAAFN